MKHNNHIMKAANMNREAAVTIIRFVNVLWKTHSMHFEAARGIIKNVMWLMQTGHV